MGSNIITLRQHDPSLLEWTSFPELDTADFALTLNDYFRLNSIDLDNSFSNWSTPKSKSTSGSDINVDFAKVGALRQGLRLIRQKPLECAFSFICSQNNNIKRISGMIDRFCTVRFDSFRSRFYSLPLPSLTPLVQKYGTKIAEIDGESYYAFPTLEQLDNATEEELQDLGFGYRAKYIVGSVKHVQSKGGESWLNGLRGKTKEEAKLELTGLPGVGPKVADCILLFSLDHLNVVPVDTHVWKMAQRYMPAMAKLNSPNPRVFAEINDFFIEKFGDHAGWAHTILFSAAIAKEKLDEAPSPKTSAKKRASTKETEDIPDSKKKIEKIDHSL